MALDGGKRRALIARDGDDLVDDTSLDDESGSLGWPQLPESVTALESAYEAARDDAYRLESAVETLTRQVRDAERRMRVAPGTVETYVSRIEPWGLFNYLVAFAVVGTLIVNRKVTKLAVSAALHKVQCSRAKARARDMKVQLDVAVNTAAIARQRLYSDVSDEKAIGTTVDPVDEMIQLGGRTWRFIDTAGIRKRVKAASGHEYYASLRTNSAIDRAELCVLVIDGGESISGQDLRLIQSVREGGRALVIAFNKWDLVDDERRYYLEREIERDLVQVQWAPRINITAKTGWHVDRLVPAVEKALEGWETRITTGQLNNFLGRLVAEHPHPVRSGKQPKIMFATQATTAPPTFVLFTSGKLEAGYERYIERRLREEFGFVGTPIVLEQRVREKRKRK